VNVSEAVSTQVKTALLAPDVPLDLVDLLERRPVDPVDQRLRRAADRALLDRVEAPLVAGLAEPVGRIEVLAVDPRRGAQRAFERRAAAREAPAAAPLARVAAPDRLAKDRAQVLADGEGPRRRGAARIGGFDL
jgi:hypothetical protein